MACGGDGSSPEGLGLHLGSFSDLRAGTAGPPAQAPPGVTEPGPRAGWSCGRVSSLSLPPLELPFLWWLEPGPAPGRAQRGGTGRGAWRALPGWLSQQHLGVGGSLTKQGKIRHFSSRRDNGVFCPSESVSVERLQSYAARNLHAQQQGWPGLGHERAFVWAADMGLVDKECRPDPGLC